MEFIRKLTKLLSKYRYVALVLALGLLLMLIPFGSKGEKTQSKETTASSQTDINEPNQRCRKSIGNADSENRGDHRLSER